MRTLYWTAKKSLYWTMGYCTVLVLHMLNLLIFGFNASSLFYCPFFQKVSLVKGKTIFTKYLDSFPFPYYIVLKKIDMLPGTLADLLRQVPVCLFILLNLAERMVYISVA